MAILKPDSVYTLGGVTVNEYLLTKHNPNNIAMPSAAMNNVIGVTIHNTEWVEVSSETTQAEQYTRATYNGNMKETRVHFYVDNVCAWQNLPLDRTGWHAADGNGDGNMKTIAIECIMSSRYNDKDKKSEDNAAKLAAALLKKYGLGIDRLYTHNHWYSKKYCPAYILPHWEKFKAKVSSYMNLTTNTATNNATAVAKKPDAATNTPTVVKTLYRVRKSWDDVKSQIGAYYNLEGAKSECKPGYSVYDESGKAVYTVASVAASLKKGDKVTVKAGAKTYDGNSLAAFVYKNTYTVMEISSDRVVIGLNGAVTAAVHKNNLVKV